MEGSVRVNNSTRVKYDDKCERAQTMRSVTELGERERVFIPLP